jgi:membrane-associated phospholipid phosphatase
MWLRGRTPRRQAVWLVATTAGAALINSILKVVVDRNRPEFDDVVATAIGKSFPSGHALNSTTVYGSLLLIALPRLRAMGVRVAATIATVSLVLAIAASRVVLVVHYITDVIAGIALGALLLVGSIALSRTWPLAEPPGAGHDTQSRG